MIKQETQSEEWQNLTWIVLRVSDLPDLRKKEGKMSILAAKSRPCKCSLRPVPVYLFNISVLGAGHYAHFTIEKTYFQWTKFNPFSIKV